MKKNVWMLIAAILSYFLLALLQSCSFAETKAGGVHRITKEELSALLDGPDTTVIDVRSERDWQQSDRKIRGAVHENPARDEKTWAGKYPKDRAIVLYCS